MSHLTGTRDRAFQTRIAASPPPEHTYPVHRAMALTAQQWPCAASVTASGVVIVGKFCKMLSYLSGMRLSQHIPMMCVCGAR